MDSKQKERQSAVKPGQARKSASQGMRNRAPQQKAAPAKRTRSTHQSDSGVQRTTRQTAKAAPSAPKKRAAAKSSAQQQKRQPTQTRRTSKRATSIAKKQEQSKYAADIVYMPPKPFSRNRLLLRLATVTAVVVALLMGLSIFFKVEKVVVSGTDKYTAWDVSQAAGITGENLLTFSRAKASGKIQLALPYVQKVRIGIKLPDTVNIYIEEIEVTYAVADQNGSWWLMSSGGKVVEKAPVGAEEGYTKLLGVQVNNPVAGEQASALEPEPQQTDANGQTLPVTITGEHRLQTVLDIVDYLEQYGIIGKAASVDVTDMGNIQLWYEQRYQVKLGDESQLGYKIKMLKSYLDSSGEYDSGILDISFEMEENKIVFSAFE